MRLVLGAALLWAAAPAWAGPAAPAAPDAPAFVPTVAADTPADLPPVICTAPGGQIHVIVQQPDRSTFAAGPGECWLTLNGSHPDSPVRVYMTFEAPGKRLGASLGDTAEDAAEWAKGHRLLRGKVETLESGKMAIGDVAVPFHRMRGLPQEGDTTRDVLFAHTVAAGLDLVLIAHWDAFHPDGLGDEAVLALRRMSLHQGDRPALTATPPPAEPVPSAPSGGPMPEAIGAQPPEAPVPSEEPLPSEAPPPDEGPPPAALGEVPPRSVDQTPIPPPAD